TGAMTTSEPRLLFVASPRNGDELGLRREAQLWRACVQLADTFRIETSETPAARAHAKAVRAAELSAAFATALTQFRQQFVVTCNRAILDQTVAIAAAGAQLIAVVLRDDDKWRAKLRSAGKTVGAVWTWSDDARADSDVPRIVLPDAPAF